MNLDIGTAHGLWSLLILAVFAAIVAWAWSGKRRDDFEHAARIPFTEDDSVETEDPGHDR